MNFAARITLLAFREHSLVSRTAVNKNYVFNLPCFIDTNIKKFHQTNHKNKLLLNPEGDGIVDCSDGSDEVKKKKSMIATSFEVEGRNSSWFDIFNVMY